MPQHRLQTDRLQEQAFSSFLAQIVRTQQKKKGAPARSSFQDRKRHAYFAEDEHGQNAKPVERNALSFLQQIGGTHATRKKKKGVSEFFRFEQKKRETFTYQSHVLPPKNMYSSEEAYINTTEPRSLIKYACSGMKITYRTHQCPP
jgi:hypothetical protein